MTSKSNRPVARPFRPATIAAQGLGWKDSETFGIAPPIYPSTSYRRAPDGSYPGKHSYTRDQNPTYDQTEAVLSALEGGCEALVFASGMAAATTIFEAIEPATHVILPESMYWTIRSWVRGLSARGRLALSLVGNGDSAGLEQALKRGGPQLVWLETPANPSCAITDIAEWCEIAHRAGARVVADNTLATPVLTRPIELGVDLVVHSATKQLNGHSDVLAGALVCARPDELWQRIRAERGQRGAVLGPFETWLLLRGMRSLFVRVDASARSALYLAERLRDHAKLSHVLYPGLADHPGHAVAAAQMRGGFGPLLSIRLLGGEAQARNVLRELTLFQDATSLGGVESLVEHRARIEGPGTNVPADLLRLSIGLEDPEDLLEDLTRALDAS